MTGFVPGFVRDGIGKPIMSEALEQLRNRLGPSLLQVPAAAPARWALALFTGRLAELSAAEGVALTPAVALAAEAQRAGDPVAWVAPVGEGLFYPPDLAPWGLDPAGLVVVRPPDTRGAARAAGRLARTGAFGLIVLQPGAREELPAPLQGRLVQHAQRQELAVLCLTTKTERAPSLGSLVSLRAHAHLARRGEGAFAWELRVLKDKRRGPGQELEEGYHGPPGLY